MTYGDRIGGYPPASKLLHWLVAACVLTTLPVSIVMGRVAPGTARRTFSSTSTSRSAC